MNLIAPDPLHPDYADRTPLLDRRSARSRDYRALYDQAQRDVMHIGFLVMVCVPLIVGLAWGYTSMRDELLELQSQVAMTNAARAAEAAAWKCTEFKGRSPVEGTPIRVCHRIDRVVKY